MKKSDLKDFMVVQLDVRNYERENEDMYLVIGNTLVSCDGYMNLSHYDENMENTCRDNFLDNSIGTYSIVKVFKIKNISNGIEFFFDEDNLNLIWERQIEIDWSKVPKWTKVQVKDCEGEEYKNRYFFRYEKDENYPFRVLMLKDDEFTGYEHNKSDEEIFELCRIHPSVTILEEWYK